MIIRVTIHAEPVIQGIRQVRLVARFAGNSTVLSFEDKTGFIMVEIVYSTDGLKRHFAVALPAILSELSLVHIGVAAVAIAIRDAFELLKCLAVLFHRLMAFAAIHLCMHPGEWISRFIMVEFDGRLELVEAMATGTFTGKRALVLVFMAGEARGIQSEISVFLCL